MTPGLQPGRSLMTEMMAAQAESARLKQALSMAGSPSALAGSPSAGAHREWGGLQGVRGAVWPRPQGPPAA